MAIEIERKYLVNASLGFLEGLRGASLVQGYLHEKGTTSRVRLVEDQEGFITLKGPRVGLGRAEFEYAIPAQDARELIAMCEGRLLTKTRYEVLVGHHVWHVDVYTGAHAGLVTAEIELDSEDEPFALPAWLGPEITFDKRFTNKRMAISRGVPLRLVA